MQHTETYSLNLIETSDTFSPAPLNENMEKLEAAITASSEAGAGADAALEARIAALEARRFVAGTYAGDGATFGQTIDLGFTPCAVLVHSGVGAFLATTSHPAGAVLSVQEGGFRVVSDPQSVRLNNLSTVYSYLAIL